MAELVRWPDHNMSVCTKRLFTLKPKSASRKAPCVAEYSIFAEIVKLFRSESILHCPRSQNLKYGMWPLNPGGDDFG